MKSAASKVFFDILESTTDAHAHWQVWWAIANQARPGLVARMNRFPDFFLSTERAHYNSFFINLAHLFDKRRDVSSIEKYLRLSKEQYSPQERSSIGARLAKHLPARTGVIEVRNNLIAHKSAGLNEKEIFAKANLRPRQIGALVDECVFLASFFAGREAWTNRVFTSQPLSDATLGLIKSIPAP